MENNCTVLINSSDKYNDTWHPFFKLFHKYWEDCPYSIILNTEGMVYKDNNLNLICLELYEQNDRPNYGERLLRNLQCIDTKYVLMLMDDFFFRSPVDGDKIKFLLEEMEKNDDISTFSFEAPNVDYNVDDGAYDEYYLRNQCSKWKFNLQAALWRKTDLIPLLKPHEDPWKLEEMGTIRAFRSTKRFYVLKKQEYGPIDYGRTPGLRWGIIRGKWVKESVVDFFKENEIEIDYSKRGFLQPEDLSSMQIRRKIDLINTIKSIGVNDTADYFLWRGIRFAKKRLGLDLKNYDTYTDYRRARLDI